MRGMGGREGRIPPFPTEQAARQDAGVRGGDALRPQQTYEGVRKGSGPCHGACVWTGGNHLPTLPLTNHELTPETPFFFSRFPPRYNLVPPKIGGGYKKCVRHPPPTQPNRTHSTGPHAPELHRGPRRDRRPGRQGSSFLPDVAKRPPERHRQGSPPEAAGEATRDSGGGGCKAWALGDHFAAAMRRTGCRRRVRRGGG